MASPVPAKSQPLHNFSLPHLKWKNHRSGRSRLAGETSSSSPPHRSPSTPWRESPPPSSHLHTAPPPPPPLRQSSPSYVSRRPSPLHKQSPMRDSESESEPSCTVPIEKLNRKASPEKSTKSVDNSKSKRSNKICIRFRNNNKHDDAVPDENNSSTPLDTTAVSSAAEDDESLPKTWNLRPRRPPMKHKQSNIGLPKISSSPLLENKTSYGNKPNKEASELKLNDHSNLVTSKKQKFSISLSRDEIEDDIFSLTGSKPSRRPKKRPRAVQKQLDTLFPGLWLGSITTDLYKVEAPPKI